MIYDKLYTFQKNIVDKFKDKSSFGLFLDMGLGKTPTALAFAEQNDCKKVIIITINAKATETEEVSGSWLSWAKCSSIQYLFYNKYAKIKDFNFDEPELLLVNYESLFKRNDRQKKVDLKDNIIAFIQNCRNNNVAIIVDESHKMKNLQSIQTQAIMQIKRLLSTCSKKVYTYLLTGTPFTQGYIDLYAQLKMLGCSLTKGNFIDMFCLRGNLPGLLGWQQPIIGYKNVEELYRLIHKYALTVKSEDVVDLPEKIFVEHTTTESHSFSMFYREFVKASEVLDEFELQQKDVYEPEKYIANVKVGNPFFRNIAWPDLKWMAETSGTFWLRSRQLSIGFQGNAEEAIWYDRTRLEQLETFLENNPDNYVLFYNYTAELFELFDICEKLDYNIDVYCGEIKSLKHYDNYVKLTDEEKLTKKKNIIIANFASGSTGMNWQEYNKCIIFSLPLYKDYEQGIKRVHRLGQKSTVIYHIFYQKNWLDYSMKKSLDEAADYSLKMFEADLRRINELKQQGDEE